MNTHPGVFDVVRALEGEQVHLNALVEFDCFLNPELYFMPQTFTMSDTTTGWTTFFPSEEDVNKRIQLVIQNACT